MKRMNFYILKNKVPVPIDVTNLTQLANWANWFEAKNRTVRKDKIGEMLVSTVFLGIDHQFIGEGPPILFETLVFGGPMDGEMDRYSTWSEAVKGHNKMVREVMKCGERGKHETSTTGKEET